MGKIKQLLIQEQEREYECAHEEWLIRRHEEEMDGEADQLDTLERRTFTSPVFQDDYTSIEAKTASALAEILEIRRCRI
jgi:hypothetical protein